MFTRRRFLQASSALVAGCATGQPRFASDPFKLGVASGYPTPDGFEPWTRLMGLADPAPIRVHWEVFAELAPSRVQGEVFADDAARKVVASGDATAEADWAHSVPVHIKGL